MSPFLETEKECRYMISFEERRSLLLLALTTKVLAALLEHVGVKNNGA